jgi:ubiquinone/menaquinone biosynthesis C-methylase UbiE/2-polyprenyl-6-methoxyphenol hydroxylase-like FAD-dependent oxidoreductase
MARHRAGHAAVIGGGMAGLLAAQALSDHFAEVTVVERDRLPDRPDFRNGVPQARHLHTFWAGGLRAVEQLLPGIEADLIAAGACPVRFPTDIRWLTPVDRWMGRFPATQRLASASRILIEWVVRGRVEQTPGIRFITGHEVRSLRLDRHGDVSGLTTRARRGDGSTFELPADLVVDASGRGSSLPDWLQALDRRRPRESTVDAFLGYASRTYAIPDDFRADWKSTYIQAAPPRDTRGGIMMPIEGNRWIVTLLGGGRDYPPTDEVGFLEFARSLRSSALYDVIADAEPLSPVWGYRHTSNHRRHYEQLPDMPGRLLVVGDSLCMFNPLYGQGMTIAALQAEALTGFLRRHLDDPADLPALVRPAQRAVASCTAGAWLVATGSDLRYPVTAGAQATFATRLLHRHLDRVFAAATADPSVNAAFLRVLNMVDTPQALFRPGTMARAVLGSHRAAADHDGPRHPPGGKTIMRATDTAAFTITTPFGRLYSAWYDHYMAPGVFKVLETDLHGRFMERVGPGSRVLDVGCGGGQHAVHIAHRRPDVRVVGVDLSAELIRRARRLAAKAGVAGRVEFVEGDALNLDFPDRHFDHVYCAGSIKHWPDQRRGLNECLRVLRRGGRLLVMEADRSCMFADVRSWARDTRTPRPLLPALHAYFRTYIAGQSLDLDDARALWGSLPLDEVDGPRRIPNTPTLIMCGTKR